MTPELPMAPIDVQVNSQYLADQSLPMQHRYVFAYQISLTNHGDQPLTLHSRYWRITNDLGQVEEVEGEGVVGQQPTLAPGENYFYTSGAILATPYGQMEGHYVFHGSQGTRLIAPIAPFLLAIPRTLH